MTAERPTLTIAVPCPTCGGITLEPGKAWVIDGELFETCPDCTDGTIRQAASCQSCKWFSPVQPDPFDTIPAPPGTGRCDIEADLWGQPTGGRHMHETWGCLSWEAKA